MLGEDNDQMHYNATPASKIIIDSSWYTVQEPRKSFDECVSACRESNMCTGFHYVPRLQICGFLTYALSYEAKSQGAGDILFYLLDIDTSVGQG